MASTQFKSTDTTPWWLKYGNGSDGAYSSSGSATDAPVDSSCSGTVDTTSLSATNASFANGKPILIHQSRGTGAGSWELNQIASYTSGTITTVSPLKNTYTDSGASQAQVIQLKQYSSFTQNSGHTLTAKAWDGNVGGIIAFLAKGTVIVNGAITAAGKGYVSGGGTSIGGQAAQGEGSAGAGGNSTAANGSGGGGGLGDAGNRGPGGGGGGNGGAGEAGMESNGNAGGTGGSSVGTAGLTTMLMGGHGGGGARGSGVSGSPGTGANGGGIVAIFGKEITVTGSVVANGNNGGGASVDGGGGGGGAGGSVLLKAVTATLGSSLVTAAGGSRDTGGSAYGGAGGTGRIHLDYLVSYTGTTTPTIDVTQDYSLSSAAGNMFLVF